MPIRAVGFDIDGTLYPTYRFNLRVLPILISDLPLLLSMGKARDELRATRLEGPFYQRQAELAARHYGRPADEVRRLLDERIYRSWEKVFSRVKVYAGVRDAILALRVAGLKTGVLSDFPATAKLALLGLSDLWDCVLCSEEVGHLKPATDSFIALARSLDVDPADILYVGNSPAYDVAGAKAAGMMAACIASRGRSVPGADFVFSSYRELTPWIMERAKPR